MQFNVICLLLATQSAVAGKGNMSWDIGQLFLALKHSGGLQDEPSFAFNRAVRPASAPETKAAPYSSLAAAPAWALPAGSKGSAGTAHSARGHPAPAGIQHDMISASQRHHNVPPAGANRPHSRQQQHWPGHVMPGQLSSTLRDDGAMPAQSSDAGVDDFAAYTPQELADHLQQLKKEFREIYSSILDGDSQSPRQVAAEGVSLLALPCCQETAYTVLVFGFLSMATNHVAFSRSGGCCSLGSQGNCVCKLLCVQPALRMLWLSHLQANALPLEISCQLKQQCVLSAAGGHLRQ